MSLPIDFWHQLHSHFKSTQCLQDPSACLSYSYDNGRHQRLPLAVILPESLSQIQKAIQLCYQFAIPVTARGRGTGTPGGAIASPDGIVLSLERLTNILDCNVINRTVTVEAGVLNQTVQNLAAEHHLFWPPDPGSAAFCTIGGNLAYNAGGPRAVKYGTTRDHVLALTAITGTGAIIETGFVTAKSACGYDLTRLLIGSEGTLAIIATATLKLSVKAPAIATIQVWFDQASLAVALLPAILACPIAPCAVEYLDEACLTLIRHNSGLDIPETAQALLLIEIDGLAAMLPEAIEYIKQCCQSQCLSFDSSIDPLIRQQLWAVRKALSPALRQLGLYKINEDIVVPIDRLNTFFTALDQLKAQYPAFTIVTFGHIGSGNLHVNAIMPQWNAMIQQQVDGYLSTLFDTVLALGGTLSGEHGIGLDKKAFLTQAINPATLDLMQAIKTQFDPRHILNPDKLWT